MTRLGSLSEVHLQKLILRDDLLVATHLRAVEPATLLAATPSFSCTESRVLRLHGTLLIARDAVELAHCRLSPGSPCEALIACLVVAVVEPGADHGPSRRNAEEEANDHVTDRHDVVNGQIVAADTDGSVIARGVVSDVLVVTVRNANG